MDKRPESVRNSVRNLNFNITFHVPVFIRHINAYFHGLCIHNLRLSRETKSNAGVGRQAKKKKVPANRSTSSVNYA